MEPGDESLYRELGAHLEGVYGVNVAGLSRLQQNNAMVHRVDLADGACWVARLFSVQRPLERVISEAEILRLLEQENYPAERLAHPEPVTVLDDGRSVIVTRFIEGSEPDGNLATTQGALADRLGRLATIPCDQGAAARPGGAWGADPAFEGRPSQDVAMADARLSAIAGQVPAEYMGRYESLRRQVDTVDDLEGLPEALVHPDPVPVNARVGDDGQVVLIHWTSVGRGPRISALGWFLGGVSAPGGYDHAKLAAVVDGYCSHVRLEDEELERLPSAMRLRGLLFACMSFSQALMAGQPPRGPGLLWATDETGDRNRPIADAIRAAQQSQRRV